MVRHSHSSNDQDLIKESSNTDLCKAGKKLSSETIKGGLLRNSAKDSSNRYQGPFPIIHINLENDSFSVNATLREPVTSGPHGAPFKRFDCKHYDSCLELAAALNWENFTCMGCLGSVNKALIWKAHLAKRKDKIAKKLCRGLPTISVLKVVQD